MSGMKTRLYPQGPPRSEPATPKLPPSREDLATRKARQALEGVSAMAEYEQQQRATLERTERLRAERLARETKKTSAQKSTASQKNTASKPAARKTSAA
jgi:hypothetical protein